MPDSKILYITIMICGGATMSIRIIADSGSDYEQDEIKAKNIEVIPIPISFGGQEYLSGINLSKNQFFDLLKQNSDFPKTAQPSPSVYLDIFQDAKKSGDDVILIMLSGSLSGMLQTAVLCKNNVDYDRIHIINSANATAGIRLLVDNAVKMRDEGKTAEEIVEATETLKKRIRLYATFPTLSYLVKGGRLSRFEASAAAIARIKPVITIGEEGEVLVYHKGVGLKHSIDYMAQKVFEEQIDSNYPVFPIYSGDPVNCYIMLDKLESRGIALDRNTISNIGPTIGSYVGIAATGIVYVKKEL